jgi:archaellum component FlaC
MTQPTTAESADATPLEEALAKNEDATEEVKRAADELTIVRAVLEKVSDGTPPEDIELAAERAEELEEDLSLAAEKLEEVNDTLAEELKGRGTTNG